MFYVGVVHLFSLLRSVEQDGPRVVGATLKWGRGPLYVKAQPHAAMPHSHDEMF